MTQPHSHRLRLKKRKKLSFCTRYYITYNLSTGPDSIPQNKHRKFQGGCSGAQLMLNLGFTNPSTELHQYYSGFIAKASIQNCLMPTNSLRVYHPALTNVDHQMISSSKSGQI